MNRPKVEFCCGAVAQAELGKSLTPKEYRDAMRLLKKTGYQYVEYPHLAHLSEDQIRELKDYTAEVGLEPVFAHSKVLGAETPQAHRLYRDLQPICLRNAEILGVKVIVDHVAAGFQKEDIARDVKRLKESAKVVSDHGLELAVENIPGQSPEYCRQVVDEIDMPHVGCCCDTGHALLNGTQPQDAIRIMGGKLFNTHLQDCFGTEDDHLPPGIGIMSWAAIVQALFDVQYDRPWMIEISPELKKRKIPELRSIGVEKAMVLGIRYLEYFIEQASVVEG